MLLQKNRDGLPEEPCWIARFVCTNVKDRQFVESTCTKSITSNVKFQIFYCENRNSLLVHKEKDFIEKEIEKDNSFVFQ